MNCCPSGGHRQTSLYAIDSSLPPYAKSLKLQAARNHVCLKDHINNVGCTADPELLAQRFLLTRNKGILGDCLAGSIVLATAPCAGGQTAQPFCRLRCFAWSADLQQFKQVLAY